jgi:S-DNA-T family DNA segregation ATPase FtsK/SpoIIIE
MGIRWCLAVPDQIANDMILGTGAYKRGLTATVYRPGVDAGWGVLVGLADVSVVRSQFPDPDTAKTLIARATALRGGVVGDDVELAPARDVLADILTAFGQAGRNGLQWQQLLDLLAPIAPEWYGRHTAESLSALCRAAGVPSLDVKAADGSVRKGARRVDVLAAAEQRLAITDGRSQ